jgi:methyl-accepting chemotaxis protein
MDSTSLLGRLRLHQKFMVMGLIALVLASIPAYLYQRESSKSLNALVLEHEGIPAAIAGLKMVQLVQQHRGLSALFLGDVAGSAEKRASKQKEADDQEALLSAMVKAAAEPELDKAWADAERDWHTLRGNVGNRTLTPPQSYVAHTELMPKFLKVSDLLSDHYGLSLDPDMDTYQLIQAMFYQLPYLSEELGKTRAKGATLLAKKEASAEDRLQLSAIVARVADRLGQTNAAFSKAASANPAYQSQFGAAMQEATAAAQKITALALEQIVKPETLDYPADQYVTACTQAIDLQFALNSVASKAIDVQVAGKVADFKRTRWMLLGSSLALLALATYIGMLVARSITEPLANAIGIAQNVSKGNLVNEIEVGPDNEVGQLLRALKDMNEHLRQLVGDVRASIDSIGAATRDIASGNADVSSRLEAQASSLEETASSMEELTSTVRQNAEHAREANELVINASGVASKGGNVVSQVVHTMGEINDSSRKIVDIISVIDGIAFQTNILALNAAVEAARAGEQGRGFAVVASEVRNLAQRSAAAAKEIKTLIDSSVERVEVGNRLADEAGVAMNDIVSSVQQITHIMSDIAVASAEQDSGIEQINHAVTQMDDMTQQNAALVEQTAAASASLQEQAQALVNSMSVFILGDEAVQRRPALAASGRKPAAPRQLGAVRAARG